MVAACSSDDSTSDSGQDPSGSTATDEAAGGQRFPDVVDVDVERNRDAYDFEVTISSPYDTPDRYADGWRITGIDGTVYGEHELAHDHADEQPFTRTQQSVVIPDGIDEVIVEGRDLQNGYGGQIATVSLPED